MQTNRRHPFGIFSTAVLFIYALWFPGFSQESSEKQDFEFGQKLVHEGLFDLAVIQFARFVKDFPSSPRAGDAQFGVAESQFAMNRFNDARLSYITVLLEYPTHPQLDKAQFRIAECFEKEGASHQAMESYGRVHQYYPKSVYVNESLYRAARLAEGAGLYDNATSILQLLLEMEPTGETRSKALFLLSRIKLVKEEYETAVALLEPLANRPIRDRDAVNALIAIGQAYERQGRFEESLSQYEKAAVSTKALDLAAVAQWYRGNLLSLQGSDQEAAVAFAKAEEGLTDSSLKIQCVQASAQTAFRLGRYAAAREKWESLGQTIGFEDRLFKGQNDERLNRLTDAEQAYASLLADSLCPSDLRKKSMLFLAHLFSRTNRVERAIVFYNRFLKSYPDDPLADVVLFQKGKIYLDSLDSAADAEAAFQQLCEGYPDSRLLPASRFLLAEKNVELRRYEDARRLYKHITERYPGTAWSDRSFMRLQETEYQDDARIQEGLSALSGLLIGGQADPYRLGLLFFKPFNQYRDALRCFERVRSAGLGPSDSSAYFSAACYEALSMKENESAFADSARRRYQEFIRDFPESPLAPDASTHWIILSKDLSPKERLTALNGLGNRYPQAAENPLFLSTAGQTYLECDFLGQSIRMFRSLICDFPQSAFSEEIHYKLGETYGRLGDNLRADSCFSSYEAQYPKGRFIPFILWRRSRWATDSSRTVHAITLLETLNRRYPASPLADSAGRALGDAYLSSRQFAKAAVQYQTMIREDSLAALAESVGLNAPYARQAKIILFKLAQAYEGLGQMAKAKILYFRYGRDALNPKARAVLYSALSHVCEIQGNTPQAAAYLGLAVQTFPSDSTYENLGLHYFQLEHYTEAVSAWTSAMELTSLYSRKAYLLSRILVAEMRQDQAVQMESRIQGFEKSYANDPAVKEYSAELFLELAKTYMRQKEFEPALKCLKEVQKNKNSKFLPESEAETGKILLITNKIDKALELLTDLPRRYPRHPILGAVYLNLGDHYFRSQQFENALSAFKKASEDTSNKAVQATAMRYLIKVYDALQMWDAALATTRSYIRRFPKAEDVLEKRIQIGVFYTNLREYFAALEQFHDVQKEATDETDAEIQYWIGKCYLEMGQFEEAVLEFVKVKYVSKPTQLPWAATALYEAGSAYLRLNDRDKAKVMFQKIVTTEGPTSDLGRIAVKRIQEIDSENP